MDAVEPHTLCSLEKQDHGTASKGRNIIASSPTKMPITCQMFHGFYNLVRYRMHPDVAVSLVTESDKKIRIDCEL